MELEIWHYWYIGSILLFALEALAVPGIGFFFAAIGAFLLAVLLQIGGVPANDLIAQGGIFFVLTAISAAVLWKPLKNMRIGKGHAVHNDMVGRFATVDGKELVKGSKGSALWSGAIMNARLADNASIASATVGTELKIVEVQGSTLILAEKTYQIAQPE